MAAGVAFAVASLEAGIYLRHETKAVSSVKTFEQRYELHGFSHEYGYPGKISSAVFLKETFRGFRPAMSIISDLHEGYAKSAQRYWLLYNENSILSSINAMNDQLVLLNPQLGHVRRNPNDFRSEYHFALGVAFSFPPRDIDFFINEHNAFSLKQRRGWCAAIDRATARLDKIRGEPSGTRAGWIASPATVALMNAAAERLEAATQADAATTTGPRRTVITRAAPLVALLPPSR